ncbi:hypothetical protein AD949_02340 [Acetobacter orleanensis]|nr:hypothetical protein AD949_02340 [Acetobacter orleanensis]
MLGIQSVPQLAQQEPDALYLALCQKTQQRPDRCVHDVFAAAIYQACTSEARNWWDVTPHRKARQQTRNFPVYDWPFMKQVLPCAETRGPLSTLHG